MLLMTCQQARQWLPPMLIAALLLGGCEQPASPPATRSRAAPPAHPVAVEIVAAMPTETHSEWPATLRLQRLVRLRSQTEGRVIDLTGYPGDAVRAEQILVRQDATLWQAELDKADATARQMALDLRRIERLVERRHGSEDDLAQARTALAIAEAERRRIAARRDETEVRAPFAGIVIDRLVEPGDFVAANTHLLTLGDPASLIVETRVSESLLPHLRPGTPAKVRIDALDARDRDARNRDAQVLRVHPRLAPASRLATVEVALAQVPVGALAGQFARVRFVIDHGLRLTIPFRALQQDRDGSFVWIVDDEGRAAKRSIQTGMRVDDRIEILSGLTEGDTLVTRGMIGLTAGTLVTAARIGADLASEPNATH